jgi:hypothetical protein
MISSPPHLGGRLFAVALRPRDGLVLTEHAPAGCALNGACIELLRDHFGNRET